MRERYSKVVRVEGWKYVRCRECRCLYGFSDRVLAIARGWTCLAADEDAEESGVHRPLACSACGLEPLRGRGDCCRVTDGCGVFGTPWREQELVTREES